MSNTTAPSAPPSRAHHRLSPLFDNDDDNHNNSHPAPRRNYEQHDPYEHEYNEREREREREYERQHGYEYEYEYEYEHRPASAQYSAPALASASASVSAPASALATGPTSAPYYHLPSPLSDRRFSDVSARGLSPIDALIPSLRDSLRSHGHARAPPPPPSSTHSGSTSFPRGLGIDSGTGINLDLDVPHPHPLPLPHISTAIASTSTSSTHALPPAPPARPLHSRSYTNPEGHGYSHSYSYGYGYPPTSARLATRFPPLAERSEREYEHEHRPESAGTAGPSITVPSVPAVPSLPPPLSLLSRRTHLPPPALYIPPISTVPGPVPASAPPDALYTSQSQPGSARNLPLSPLTFEPLGPPRGSISASRPSSAGYFERAQAQSLASANANVNANASANPYSSPPQPSPYATGFLHPLSIPTSTSVSGSLPFDERALRSPHPPLTGGLTGPHLWPPPLSSEFAIPYPPALVRPFHSSPLNDAGAHTRLSPHGTHATLAPIAPLTHYPPPHPHPHPLALAHAHAGYAPHGPISSHSPILPPPHSASPLDIPPPLQFKYSASPPQLTYHADMPRTMLTGGANRSQRLAMGLPTGSAVTGSGLSGSTSSSRRKSGASATDSVSARHGNGYRNGSAYAYGSADPGGRGNPIVIESHTPEIPRKRTRAMAAAEAQAERNGTHVTQGTARTSVTGGKSSYANGSVVGSSVASVQLGASTGAAGKKRKMETAPKAPPAKRAPAKTKKAYASPAQPKPVPSYAPPPIGAPPTWDDAEGHFIIKPDDIIASKYKIVRLLGQGTFGKVVEAREIQSRRKVAIKIIRAVQKYRDASKIEIRVLNALRKHDPNNVYKCVHLDEYLDYKNHPCLVTELYGMSVFDFLKLNSFQPFPEKHIQDFALCLLKSVQYVHSLRLVHTDLKPENILLVSNDSYMVGPRAKGAKSKRILRNTDIRLIDFGSATFEDEYHSSVVSTRHYRAPEIILGLPWSYPCDIYSIGCILVEFFTGDALFQTHDNLEHLGMMEVVMGKMPRRMEMQGRQKKPEFFGPRGVDFPNNTTSKSSRKFVKGLKHLKDIIVPDQYHNKHFLDLITRMLDFDPSARITVDQCLGHPYFRSEVPPPPSS